MNIQEDLIEERRIREDGQNKLIQMVKELDERLNQDLNVYFIIQQEKKARSLNEETLFSLLEETLQRIEISLNAAI